MTGVGLLKTIQSDEARNLVKFLETNGLDSMIEKRLCLGDLYKFIDDLGWIQEHPEKDYTLLEVCKLVNEAKEIEKIKIDEKLNIEETLANLTQSSVKELSQWHRIDND
jgi:hypothetical protein